jgi:hypothetical protein
MVDAPRLPQNIREPLFKIAQHLDILNRKPSGAKKVTH